MGVIRLRGLLTALMNKHLEDGRTSFLSPANLTAMDMEEVQTRLATFEFPPDELTAATTDAALRELLERVHNTLPLMLYADLSDMVKTWSFCVQSIVIAVRPHQWDVSHAKWSRTLRRLEQNPIPITLGNGTAKGCGVKQLAHVLGRELLTLYNAPLVLNDGTVVPVVARYFKGDKHNLAPQMDMTMSGSLKNPATDVSVAMMTCTSAVLTANWRDVAIHVERVMHPNSRAALGCGSPGYDRSKRKPAPAVMAPVFPHCACESEEIACRSMALGIAVHSGGLNKKEKEYELRIRGVISPTAKLKADELTKKMNEYFVGIKGLPGVLCEDPLRMEKKMFSMLCSGADGMHDIGGLAHAVWKECWARVTSGAGGGARKMTLKKSLRVLSLDKEKLRNMDYRLLVILSVGIFADFEDLDGVKDCIDVMEEIALVSHYVYAETHVQRTRAHILGFHAAVLRLRIVFDRAFASSDIVHETHSRSTLYGLYITGIVDMCTLIRMGSLRAHNCEREEHLFHILGHIIHCRSNYNIKDGSLLKTVNRCFTAAALAEEIDRSDAVLDRANGQSRISAEHIKRFGEGWKVRKFCY